MLARQGCVETFLDQLLAGPGNGVGAGIQCLGDLAIGPCAACFGGVGFQQNTRLQHLTGTMLASLDQRVEAFALFLAQLDDVLPLGCLFRGHDASPAVAGRSIQKQPAKSMTAPTSLALKTPLPRLDTDHGCEKRTFRAFVSVARRQARRPATARPLRGSPSARQE